MAIFLWGFCIFLAWFLVKKILEKYFNGRFSYTNLGDGTVFRLRAPKIDHFKALLVTVIIAGLSPLYYEYPNWGLSYVASQKSDGTIVKHPWGKFCWNQENCFNIQVGKLFVNSSVSPVTSNPKIRPLKYSVEIIIEDEEKFVEKFSKAKEDHILDVISFHQAGGFFANYIGMIAINEIKYNLLEFNETNSKEISKFYNYLDQKQQTDFKKFVEDWVNPRLTLSGLSIKCNDFMIVEL